MNEVQAPTLRNEVEREIAVHEVFMSFVNDEDAILFHEWWNDRGWLAFQKWAQKELRERME